MHGIEVINKMNAMKDPDTFVLTGVGERLYPNKVDVEEEHRARVTTGILKGIFEHAKIFGIDRTYDDPLIFG